MRNLKKMYFLQLLIIYILFLMGCSPIIQTQQVVSPSQTGEPILAITSIPRENLSELPTYTPLPTIIPSQEQRISEKLLLTECKLPCYLGIIPGKTLFTEAGKILINLGGIYSGVYHKVSGEVIYYYSFKISEFRETTQTPELYSGYSQIYSSVELSTTNEIVQKIRVISGVYGVESFTKYQNYWSRYFVRGILEQLGYPEYLYLNQTEPPLIMNNRTLLMGYESLGVIAILDGYRNINNLCPENEGTFSNLTLYLSNKKTSMEVFFDSFGNPSSLNSGEWTPAEKELKVNPVQFYNRVMKDPLVCFPVK